MENYPDIIWNPFQDDEEEKQKIREQIKLNNKQDVTSGQLPLKMRSNFVDLKKEESLGDLWQAQIGYQYDPILERAYRWRKYKDKDQDPNFNALQNMDGYEEHTSSLVGARNQEEEDDIKRSIDENRERRETMSNFGFGANMLMGVLDPVNLLTIPFAGAGFVTAGARSFGGFVARRALATGAGVGLTQGVLEAIRAPFDPENTEYESLTNITLATVAGAVIGGAVSVPAARRRMVTAKTILQNEKVQTAHDNLVVNDLDKLDVGDGINRAERKFGGETQETLDAGKNLIPKTIEKLKKKILENKKRIMESKLGARLIKELEEFGEITSKTIDELDSANKKLLLGERAGDPDFYYHGTNEKTTFVDGRNLETDAPILGYRTLDRYIDKKGNLIIKQTPDDIVGSDLNGVSLADNVDDALVYTASKDKFGTGRRDDTSVGGDDSIIFKIKASAIKKTDMKQEAMGETLVEKDLVIPKGQYEIIRFGKNATKNSDNVIPELGVVNLFKALKKNKDDLKEMTAESNLRTLESSRNKTITDADKYSFINSWFTDSWFYTKFLATPYKNIMQGNYPVEVKMYMHDLGSDNGVSNKANELGLSNGNAVYTMAAMRHGEWVVAMDSLMKIFGRGTNQGTKKILDIVGGPKGFEEWAKELNLKYMKSDKANLTDIQKEGYEVMSKFWTMWGERLEKTGLIGNKVYFQEKMLLNDLEIKRATLKITELENSRGSKADAFRAKIEGITEQIQKLENEFAEQGLTTKKQATLKKLNAFLDNYTIPLYSPFVNPKAWMSYKAAIRKVKRLTKQNEDFDLQLKEKVTPRNEENMFARFWDRDAIVKDRAKLEKVLYDWYELNPRVYKFDEASGRHVEKELSIDPRDLSERAKNTVDEILGIAQKDPTGEDVVYYGMGKSKHFKHRAIDIPNSLVFDFIVNDPIAVMKAYVTRVAPRYEYAVKHKNKSLEDVLENIDIAMSNAGKNKLETDKVRMNYQHMYDRIVGSVMRKDPASWDMMAVKMMRDAAQTNYLGSAGFSTLPDMAKILMEHDSQTLKAILLDVYSGDKRILMNAEEGRIGGEIIDIARGAAGVRMSEELSNNPFSKGFYDKYADKAKNAFYIANLLAPATKIFKEIDSMARVHTLVDLALRKHKGNNYKAGKDGDNTFKELTQFEITYAARYNIDDVVAKDIAELVENGTIEKTNNGLYLGNTDKWPTHMSGTRDNFRASLNSGILNTILMGTPADKPILVDGVFFIPMRVARKLGLEEDGVVRGYHRIESPLLGMPFQFMSYAFAATNKITAGLAHDQIRNRKSAIALSIGLGYMSLLIKSKFGGESAEYAWDEMSYADKFARSFDQSGIAALMSDMFYMSLAVSNALGGPDLSMGLLKQKGPPSDGVSITDAVTTVTGAGGSITHDFFRNGVFEFLSGNHGEGSKHIIRNLPAMRLWFLKGFVNDMSKDWGKIQGREPLNTGGGRF